MTLFSTCFNKTRVLFHSIDLVRCSNISATRSKPLHHVKGLISWNNNLPKWLRSHNSITQIRIIGSIQIPKIIICSPYIWVQMNLRDSIIAVDIDKHLNSSVCWSLMLTMSWISLIISSYQNCNIMDIESTFFSIYEIVKIVWKHRCVLKKIWYKPHSMIDLKFCFKTTMSS